MENAGSIKYIGVTITSDFRANAHIGNSYRWANRTMSLLSLYPADVKETAYKGLVWSFLECAFPIWGPHSLALRKKG